MAFSRQVRAVVTDVQFLVPFCVLAAGILLLALLH